MPSLPDYENLSVGEWKLKVLREHWSDDMWKLVFEVLDRQAPNKHPQTVALNVSREHKSDRLFLKIFHGSSGMGAVKDWFRESKAFRFLRQGLALSAAGFFVPTTIAAGEERRQRFLKRAFVLTSAVKAEPPPTFLRARCASATVPWPITDKRTGLAVLGREIRRFHDLGFVHGDLVPSNILIAEVPGGGFRFYLMDNDRTRRYPQWLAQSLWKRNLIQLNRFPLPGISLQDRLRFYRAYSGRREFNKGDCALLRWLETKTRKRRKKCDAVDSSGSFRKLMSWGRGIPDKR